MKRTETTTIRLTPEEKAALEKAAAAEHLSLSTWLRVKALGWLKRRK